MDRGLHRSIRIWGGFWRSSWTLADRCIREGTHEKIMGGKHALRDEESQMPWIMILSSSKYKMKKKVVWNGENENAYAFLMCIISTDFLKVNWTHICSNKLPFLLQWVLCHMNVERERHGFQFKKKEDNEHILLK